MVTNNPDAQTKAPLSSLPVFADCSYAVDVIFLVDSSSSVGEANFDIVRRFISNIIQEMHVDTGHVRVSLVSFSADVYIHFMLNRYNHKDPMMEAVLNIPYFYGTSSLRDALRDVRNTVMKTKNGDRPEAPNVLVIITDGTPSIHVRQTEQEAQRLAEDGVHVIAIGIQLQGDEEERVGQLVTPPISRNLITIKSYDTLSDTRPNVFTNICEGKHTFFLKCYSFQLPHSSSCCPYFTILPNTLVNVRLENLINRCTILKVNSVIVLWFSCQKESKCCRQK